MDGPTKINDNTMLGILDSQRGLVLSLSVKKHKLTLKYVEKNITYATHFPA